MKEFSENRDGKNGKQETPSKPVILVDVSNPTDQDLLHKYLSEYYEVIRSDEAYVDIDFDVCLIDGNRYVNSNGEIADAKEKSYPLVLPFILLVNQNNGLKGSHINHELIDEILPIPTQIPELRARVRSMLGLRKHSVELKNKNDQLRIYEKALNSANSGIVITDANQKDNPIIFHNKAFRDITGYEEFEINGRNCRFLQKDDREQKGIKDIRSLLDNEQAGSVVLRNYRKDGSLFWNELKIAPIQDSNGHVNHFVGIQNDLTDRIRFQERISSERNLFRKLAESSPVGITLINEKGQITFANDRAEEILGLSKSEIKSLTYNAPKWKITDLDGGPFPEDKLPFAHVMKTKEAVYDIKHCIVWPDGTVKILSVNAAPLFNKQGKLDLVIASISDITEEVHSKNKLQKSVKEKEILLQEIHHRVKNNLAVVSGMLQIQRFSSEDEKLNKALEASEMRIKSMALIHEKLYESESLSEIDFKYYIQDLSSSILSTIDYGKDIHSSFSCDSIKLNVNQAVPCALIINELLSNAVEHAFDEKGGNITLSSKEYDGNVHIAIKDDGKGLPKQFIEGDMTTMGVTIIHALVSQLEADFKAYNENGANIEISFQKKDVRGSSSAFL